MSEKFVLDEKAQCLINSRALSSLSVAVGLCRKARCLPNAWTRAVSRAKTDLPVAPPSGGAGCEHREQTERAIPANPFT